MLDRVLKLIVTLTLLLFLLQSVIGVLSRMLEAALGGAVSAAGTVSSSLGTVLVVVGILSLIVGLCVRMLRFLTGRGDRAGREHAAHERQARLAVRRLAEGVPPGTSRELPEDLDPAIALEDD